MYFNRQFFVHKYWTDFFNSEVVQPAFEGFLVCSAIEITPTIVTDLIIMPTIAGEATLKATVLGNAKIAKVLSAKAAIDAFVSGSPNMKEC